MAEIWHINNMKSWRECGTTGTLIHGWWELWMVQPLWKSLRQFLTKLILLLPWDPVITLLGIYPNEFKTYICIKTCTGIFFFILKNFIFTLFYFTILYWFCHTLTWIHHGCTCVSKHEPPSHLPPHNISLDHPCAPAPSMLYPALSRILLTENLIKTSTDF